MVTVYVDPGICGLNTVIRAYRLQRESVGITIKSDCKHVMALEDELQRLDLKDIVKVPINKNTIYEKASKCYLHPSCPIPCAVIKAAEVALELAAKKDVKIEFKDSATKR